MKWNRAALLQSEYVKDESNPIWWRWLVCLVFTSCFITLLAATTYLCLSKTVSPYEVAIREAKFPFFERTTKVMSVGRHLAIPHFMPIRKLTTELQYSELTLPMHLGDELGVKFIYRFNASNEELNSETEKQETLVDYKKAQINNKCFLKLIDEVGLANWHSFVKKTVTDAVRDEINKLQKRLYTSKTKATVNDFNLDAARISAAKKLYPYGIELISVLLTALPDDVLKTKQQSNASKITLLTEEKGQLEEKLSTFNASNELNLEKIKTDINAKKAAVLTDAKNYQEKRKAEADLLMTKALVALEREKAAILAKAPDAEKYLQEKIKREEVTK